MVKKHCKSVDVVSLEMVLAFMVVWHVSKRVWQCLGVPRLLGKKLEFAGVVTGPNLLPPFMCKGGPFATVF